MGADVGFLVVVGGPRWPLLPQELCSHLVCIESQLFTQGHKAERPVIALRHDPRHRIAVRAALMILWAMPDNVHGVL